MPTPSLPENVLAELYKETSEGTKNFRLVEPDTLQENPKQLLILRLALGMSQNNFEKLIGNKSKNISKYETGKIQKMQYGTALRICEKINNKIKPVSFTKVLEMFRKSREDSMGWFKTHHDSQSVVEGRIKGAIGSLRLRSTTQELQLSSELEKLKIKNKINFPLSKNIIVDIFVPSKNLVIECKEVKSLSRREVKEQVQKLAYQGYRIKFNFQDKRVWALIKLPHKLTSWELNELKGPFEKVFEEAREISKLLSR